MLRSNENYIEGLNFIGSECSKYSSGGGATTENFYLNEANLCHNINEIENSYDQIERLSTIYISKHSHNIHIKRCTFRENSGTYGGALTIDSFNGKYGKYIYYIYIYIYYLR